MNAITLEKMGQMRLLGMQRLFQSIIEGNSHLNLPSDEFISLLVQSEWEDRESRKLQRRLHSARFRYQASIEEINYQHHRNLDKNQLLRFSDCSYVSRGENILITGPTGVGKSYIASALGNQACLKGYKVVYYNMQKLFSSLKMSKADGSYLKEIDRIARQDLLILDDFGLQALDANNRLMLLEIIEDRHGKKSTLISSQLPSGKWYEVIGESTIADAILDRLLNSSHKIDLKGESMRKKDKFEN
ncbi:MAG TPA: IS21-like element helper ATPase IstB [Chitinispirillaceae bacterium]|jgi:DNA replication protein DnaC|nr:IS21-like element helper ATPase IstB [Chitinispirillaceae bacterium]